MSILEKLLEALSAGKTISLALRNGANFLGYGRYVEAIDLQQDILSKPNINFGEEVSTSENQEIINAWDKLFSRTMEIFPHSSNSVMTPEIRRMFERGDDIETLTVEGLKEWQSHSVPVVIVRNLLAFHKKSFPPKLVPSWKEFVKIYHDSIMKA